MPSDLDTLLDMGFDKERAEIAVKKTGGRKLHFCSDDSFQANFSSSGRSSVA